MMATVAEVSELFALYPGAQSVSEAGVTFVLLPGLALPAGCIPPVVDALLCPSPRDGYESRLYFSANIAGGPARNWNGSVRIAERNWVAVSWRTAAGLRMAQMVSSHLDAVRPGVEHHA